MKKVFVISIVLIIFLFYNFSNVYASVTANPKIKETAEEWIKLGKTQKNKANTTAEWTNFNDLAGILWGIGVFAIFIVGTALGIKYMFSSVEEKASIKESIKPFIIGTVIILGALGIWKILVEFLDKIA